MTIPTGARTRIAKAAADNGFDLDLPSQGVWIGFASSHAPLRVWITAHTDLLLLAVSQANVWLALGGQDAPAPLPPGACGARAASNYELLHRLLRRAFLLSRTLPDELYRVFEAQTAALPRTTEAERLVVQRVGQDVFRGGLLDYWEGRCAITGLAVPELLRASHIKPWAACALDAERLDVFNGFLLAAHLDAAFDAGFVTIDDEGAVVVSDALDGEARALLGLDRPVRLRGIAGGHRRYLGWHRERVFRSGTMSDGATP